MLRIHAGFSFRYLLHVIGVFATFALILHGLVHAKCRVSDAERFFEAMHQVDVIPPDTAPEPSQKSVDFAIEMYGIRLPADVLHPVYDPKLEDRGLTTMGMFSKEAQISVGPAAFVSWGLLGSTLAHEIEVHCNQSFLFIGLMDLVGLDGTAEAERQAYGYELENASRFGLSNTDAALIASTVSYYYPEQGQPGVRKTLRKWFARNLLPAR